jgi:rare lipoprotein A
MKTLILILFITFICILLSCKKKSIQSKIFCERTVYQKGVATWYGPGFHGKTSASGDIFDTQDFTAAHKTLKFGTLLRVTNLENGNWCVVKINDRGPVSETLLLDLSNAAAQELDILTKGSAKIEIDILTDKNNVIKRLFQFSRNLGKFKLEQNKVE